MCSLEEVSLTFDEIEAMRLADLENLYQEQVATRMGVSRQTVGRILVSARKKVAEALVKGKAIRLEGGQIQFRNPICLDSQMEISTNNQAVEQIEQPKQIAITAKGPDLDSEVDLRFGRADYFIIIRLDDESKIVLTNDCKRDRTKGVGIRNSQRLIDTGAEVIVTGQIGPKVMSMITTQGIRIFAVNGGTVREALELFKQEQIVNG